MRQFIAGGGASVAGLVARILKSPTAKLIDARAPKALRAAMKTAAVDLWAVAGDARKLRALAAMPAKGLLAKVTPAIERLLTDIVSPAIPGAELAVVRKALGKLTVGLADPGAATAEVREAIGKTVGRRAPHQGRAPAHPRRPFGLVLALLLQHETHCPLSQF